MGSGASTPKEKLVLYVHHVSPPCRAVMMTAKAIGLDLDLKVIDLMKGEQNEEKFLKINPDHTLPTLVDAGFTLWESRAIMSYLVDKYSPGHTLYPKDPAKRALVDRLMIYDLEKVIGAVRGYCLPVILRRESPSDEKAKDVEQCLDYIEKLLEKQAYVAAPHVTLADICLAASLSLLEVTNWSFSKWEKVSNWRNSLSKEQWYMEANKGFKDFMKQAATAKADES